MYTSNTLPEGYESMKGVRTIQARCSSQGEAEKISSDLAAANIPAKVVFTETGNYTSNNGPLCFVHASGGVTDIAIKQAIATI